MYSGSHQQSSNSQLKDNIIYGISHHFKQIFTIDIISHHHRRRRLRDHLDDRHLWLDLDSTIFTGRHDLGLELPIWFSGKAAFVRIKIKNDIYWMESSYPRLRSESWPPPSTHKEFGAVVPSFFTIIAEKVGSNALSACQLLISAPRFPRSIFPLVMRAIFFVFSLWVLVLAAPVNKGDIKLVRNKYLKPPKVDPPLVCILAKSSLRP